MTGPLSTGVPEVAGRGSRDWRLRENVVGSAAASFPSVPDRYPFDAGTTVRGRLSSFSGRGTPSAQVAWVEKQGTARGRINSVRRGRQQRPSADGRDQGPDGEFLLARCRGYQCPELWCKADVPRTSSIGRK